MTTLSAKARAFSVDQLLGRCEQRSEPCARDGKPISETSDELCPAMGEEPACSHRNTITVKGASGEHVTVELCQGDLWQAFHNLGTEMIITKTGRRMFPAIRVRISGLRKTSRYKLTMDFVPVDKNKYRYVYHSSKWMVSGVGDGLKHERKYVHPDSPFSGEYISSQVISFEKIKLTNNDNPPDGQVSLLSMQKFQPRITIEEQNDTGSQGTGSRMAVSFPQTSFIAVTAYQNQEITRLKIARNPFAKGFREAGKCRSSLEAMMASLGAYIDPKQDSYHRKRHLDPEETRLEDAAFSPTKRRLGVWPHLTTAPTMIPDSRYLSSYFHLTAGAVPMWTNPYIYSDLLNKTSTPELEDSRSSPNQYSRAPEHKHNRDKSATQSVSSHSPETQDTDSVIHPAFRWTGNPPGAEYSNVKSNSGFGNGLLYNPLTSIMYFTQPRPWAGSSSRGCETTATDLVTRFKNNTHSPNS